MILYGVTHHGTLVDGFGRTRHHLRIRPSPELLEELASLSPGSRVGSERATSRDWKAVKQDLRDRLVEADFVPDLLRYPKEPERYWADIADACRKASHQVVYLEERGPWLRYHAERVRFLAQEREEDDRIIEEAQELVPVEECFRRMVDSSERERTADVGARKIHELEREETLLAPVREGRVDAAVVGSAHSAWWVHSQLIPVERYAAEQVDFSDPDHPVTWFVRNPPTDEEAVSGRECLERAVRLLEQGRIVAGREPDYVGTWKVDAPSRGYFEVFVEAADPYGLEGTIEDCLGSARFSTWWLAGRPGGPFVMEKKYVQARPEAMQGPIFYRGLDERGEIHGEYRPSREPFYMIRSPGAPPKEMSRLWYERARKGQMHLAFS